MTFKDWHNPSVSSLPAPHSSSFWFPYSWQGQIYSSESSTRWLRVYWSQFELAWNQTAEDAFSAVGFPPLLWYWWNPKDACSQMSQREGGSLKHKNLNMLHTSNLSILHLICTAINRCRWIWGEMLNFVGISSDDVAPTQYHTSNNFTDLFEKLNNKTENTTKLLKII